MQRQSLKRGLNKDWSQEMQRQSLKRSLNKDCEVAARLFLVENGSVLNLAVVWKNTSRLLSLSTAAFTCNCTKQAARTLRVLFVLPALSRRPWLWPATVLRRLISGLPAYSPTTSYYIYNYPSARISALISAQSLY